jgi:glycosyltransferase involved in cell wall biosynthesis
MFARVVGLAGRLIEAFRVGSFDVVIVEKECIPYAPYVVESLLLGGAKRVILDYDDAVWVAYQGNHLLQDKICRIMKRSDVVVAGSRHLQEYARENNKNTFLVPTVVDLQRYGIRPPQGGNSGNRATIIGWIGTPVTSRYLSVVCEPLRRIASRRPIVFLCVGASDAVNIPGVLVRRLQWSLESEVESIGQMDIGIMPLTDDAFTRGKCGYKLIQYMAGGLPTVASDVGENRYIISDGDTGFLIRNPQDWETAIEKLCESPALRVNMGERGRQRVLENYDISHAVGAYVRILKNLSS